jgi:hypothetical protein
MHEEEALAHEVEKEYHSGIMDPVRQAAARFEQKRANMNRRRPK